MGTKSFASVNYMSDDYAERLYNRLIENHAYYVENNTNTTKENKWELTSAEALANFYNNNTTIQNFINESVTATSFANVIFVQSNTSSDPTNLYIFFCNDGINPKIDPSYMYNQFTFTSTPCVPIRIAWDGALYISGKTQILTKTFYTNTDDLFAKGYADKSEILADIIIENNIITKASNYIPYIFNGENIEFPFTTTYYNGNYYRLDKALSNGYVEPPKIPEYDNSTITGTLTPSGDDYIINAQVSGDIDYSQGSAELTSGDIDNLHESVSGIIGEIVPSTNVVGMFYQIISGFNDALIGTGNQTIKFEYNGKNHVINSDDINLPIPTIRNFIGLFFNVAIIMAIGLSIMHLIRRMEEGDLITVLHHGDADEYTYRNDLNMF